MTPTRPTLFISHSSKDKEWAERMREALRGEGYGAFLDLHPDDGIHPGAKWEQTLWRRLRQSGGVIVLCTANWLGSPWCVAEAMIAREQGKTVFLLATADIADSRQVKGTLDGDGAPQFPDFLKDTQFIPLAGLTVEEAYATTVARVGGGRPQEDFAVPSAPIQGSSRSRREMPPCSSAGRTRSRASVKCSINADLTTPTASSWSWVPLGVASRRWCGRGYCPG